MRLRCAELGLLPPLSVHELGWRREYALVGKVWRLGHPAEAEGDVAPLIDAIYRERCPDSDLLRVLPIRADEELRAAHAAAEDAELEAMADGRYDAEAAAAAAAAAAAEADARRGSGSGGRRMVA